MHDAETLYAGPARHPADDTLAWLVAYANDPTRPSASLARGMVVTTGALTGAMPLAGPGLVQVAVAGEHAIRTFS